MSKTQKLRVGMVGYGFMGAAHAHAWRTVNRFHELPLIVDLVAVCGRDAERVAAAATRLGFRDHETDWETLIDRADIDVIDVCTPGDTHAAVAIAALEAGKHVLCEKPLANTVEEAEGMSAAAARARRRGVRSMVGFNYRRVPALSLARDMIAGGEVGTIRHVRAQYLQDWIVDTQFPLVWRLDRDRAGSGALGDLGAHIVDLAQYLTGDHIVAVTGMLETFVDERPLAADSDALSATAGDGRGKVTVDDAALFLARFRRGAVATFEATRFACGHKNSLRIEVNGSGGSISFDFESMNELQFYDEDDVRTRAGPRRILVTEPDHPYLAAWWPPGHVLGYDHLFVHEIRDFVAAIDACEDPAPSFADGLQVQEVLGAVEASATDRAWHRIDS